jgi:Apea-like HEPN
LSQNNELKAACEQWVQAVLRFFVNKQMPYKEDIEVTLTPNGYETRSVRYMVDFDRLYLTSREELLTFPEYKNVENLVLNTTSLSAVLCIDAADQIYTPPETQMSLLESYLMTLLIQYLTKTQKFIFKTEVFEPLYDKLEQYIYSTEPLKGVWLVFLRNLSSEIDSIQIDRYLILRQATYAEKVSVVKASRSFPGYLLTEIPMMFLEIHRLIDKTSPPDEEEAIKIAQSVVLALRLLKPSPVGISTHQWSVPDQPFRQGAFYSIPPLHPLAFSGEPYVLTQEDIAILPKLYKKAKRTYQNSELTTAITRFEDSYTRMKLEEKLIDYWVVLEALFFSIIPKEYVGSMGETVAANIAYYIGNTESERRSIYAFIYSSHKARGYFVHGQRGTRPENLDLTIKKTEQYLRTALRKRIEE